MSFRFFYLLSFSFLVGSVNLVAQFNQTETFTYADGMAMTECGIVHCDKIGKIWTRHSTGWVSRFDGRTFTTFSPEQIGSRSDGGQFIEDRQGLWLQMNNSVSLFRDEKWKSWILPGANHSIVDKESDQLIIQDLQNNLWMLDTISSQWIKYSQLPSNTLNGGSLIFRSRFEDKYLLVQFDSHNNWKPGKTFISRSLLQPEWIEDTSYLRPGPEWAFHHISSTMSELIQVQFPERKAGAEFRFITTSQNKLVYSESVPDSASKKFIIRVYVSDDQHNFRFLASFLTGHKNLGIALDLMGNVWVGSHSGLQRVHTNILQCFDNVTNMVPSLHVINEDDQGRIWFGGYTSGLSYFENGEIHPAPANASQYTDFLPGAFRDQQGNMAFWTEDFWLTTYYKNTWHNAKTEIPETGRIVGYYFLPIRNQRLAAGMQNFGLGITSLPLTTSSTWSFIDKKKGLLLDNVVTIAEDHKGRLWAGRPSQGVAVYDPIQDTAQTWLITLDTMLRYGMMCSVVDQAGRLWMGCTDGLRVIDHPESFALFTDELHLMTRKIVMDEAGYNLIAFMKIYNGFLVFGNQNGYGFVDLASYEKNPSNPSIFYYATHNHGGSSEQNTVLIDSKGFLWMGQDRGATRINMKDFILDSVPVSIAAKYVTIKEQNGIEKQFFFSEDHKVCLPVNKRSIVISIEPSFSGWLMDNLGIQYRLVHQHIQDTLWSLYTRNFDIRLDYLPPGKNILQVRAIKNNQFVYQSEYIIYLPRTVFESLWFWLGVFLSLSLVGFIVTQRIYRQRLHLKLAQINLAEQQREKNQFQISAIANSLNPHFIKNTLMWMQSRFRKDEQVVDVIDRLAFNISSVFSQSRKGQAFHSLGDEMKVTENFVAIQMATYGTFIDIDFPEVSSWQQWKNIVVPLLQFQIHVENAIEHGLRQKAEGTRTLSLSFREEEDYIVCIIQDNGIGRKASKERGSRGSHQGTSMLDRVYELFNQRNEYHFRTEYEDLYDADKRDAMGTNVIIYIPKRYNTQFT